MTKRLWFKRGRRKHDTVMYLENNSSLTSWWHTFSWQFCFGYISILALSRASPLRWWWKTTQTWSRIQINYKQFSPCPASIRRKGPKVLLFSSRQSTLQFWDCQIYQYAAEPKPTWILRWYVLHLNEWCQACPIWWQVFIYCFTDNILHRVTLEVKSPDRTLFWLAGDRGEDEHTFIKHTL